MYESARLAAVFLDAGLRIRSFSPEFGRIFSLRDRDRSRPIWEAVPDFVPEQGWAARLDAAARTGLRGEAPLELMRSGQTFLVAVTGYRTNAGALDGAVLTLTDVTEIKRAKRDHSQLTAIVHCSEDAIVGLDPEGLVLTWNPAAERLLGWTGEEILGREASVLVPDERRAEHDQLLGRMRQGERAEPLETVLRHKDGRALPVILLLSPVSGLAGAVVGVSMIVRPSQNVLDEKLYTIAHDLRGPLRSIGSFAELLLYEKGDALDPVAKDYAERIARGAQKMDLLLSDLVRK